MKHLFTADLASNIHNKHINGTSINGWLFWTQVLGDEHFRVVGTSCSNVFENLQSFMVGPVVQNTTYVINKCTWNNRYDLSTLIGKCVRFSLE